MIKLTNVGKVYNKNAQNEYEALKNVNLSLADNGLVVICGKSGSGKSTLLNIISGLDIPTSGTFETSYDEDYASFLFQDAQLLEKYTVKENLDLALSVSTEKLPYDSYITQFELEGLLNHKTNELSSGQKMRVALIRAIILNRPVIICDEPTGALDNENSIKIAEFLKELSRNRLVIVATHDKDNFESIADEFIQIEDGNLEIIKEEKVNIDTKYTSKNKPRLTFKTALKYSLKSIKKNIVKYICSIISLLLTFTLLILSLSTILVDEATARYDTYVNNNITYLDCQGAYVNGTHVGLVGDEIEKLMSYDKSAIRYVDGGLYSITDVNITRTYLTNKCSYDIIYGKSTVLTNEIIISDVLAYDYSILYSKTYGNELIGNTLGTTNLIIAGIYNTNFEKNNYIVGSFFDEYHRAIFVTEETYYLNRDNSLRFNVIINGLSYSYSFYIDSSLSDYEIALSNTYSNFGSKVDINIPNQYYYQKNDRDKYDSVSFNKAKYDLNIKIFEAFVNEKTYNELFENYGMYNDEYFGVAYENYSKELISKVLSNGFSNNTYIENDLSDLIDYTELAARIESIFAIIMFLLATMMVVIYVSSSIKMSKRELGVFASLGVKKNKLYLLFVPDLFLAIVISYIVSMMSSYGMFILQTKIISTSIDNPFQISYGYFSCYLVPVIFILCIILTGMVLFVSTSKLKKKNIIDLIYEK